MRARRVFAPATPLLLALVVAGACSFPEVTFHEGGGGSSASASSGASSSAGGSGQGGQGGEAQSSASATGGGQGGQGGGGQGGQGGGGQGGQGGQGGVNCSDPDFDNDTRPSIACGGTDCDDNDPNVFAEQTNYFEKARPNGSFDYNCNTVEEREFETVKCSGVACAAKTNVFIGDPMKPALCGSMASFGDCSGFCQTSNLVVKPMRCR
jgi:hypothetical protein